MTTTSPATSRTEIDAGVRPDPAALVRRAAARAVDMFTVLFLSLAIVVLGLAPVMATVSDRMAPEPWGRAFAATVLYTIVATVYEVIFVARRGQTPGKDLCNVRVVDRATGEPPGWRAACVRTIAVTAFRLVPGPMLGTVAVGLLGTTSVRDAERRGIHDLAAGTIVVDHDADAELEADGPDPTIDREDLARVYGPRSVWSYVVGRRERR